jgi:hypothetical protein
MPDRSSTVRSYYLQHPEWFTAERHDENRRRSLPHLIETLHTVHPEDADQWGVLVKTDRNNKIPCDVLVWLGDQNHVDVCDSQGGIWIPHGNIAINGGGRWTWAPPSVVDPTGEERALFTPPYNVPTIPAPVPVPEPGTPVPIPGTSPSVDLGPVLAELAALQQQVSGLAAVISSLVRQPVSTFPAYRGAIELPGWMGGNRPIALKPEAQ